MRIRNKKGFSITEVVVAMSIVVFVSIATISIFAKAGSTINNTKLSMYANNDAYNIVECFKSSDNYDDFRLAIYTLSMDYEKTDYGFDARNRNKYIYELNIIVDFDSGSLVVSGYNTETNKRLCYVSYRKGQ